MRWSSGAGTSSTVPSTNLTSKRTSHKIAEQGRRNRINQALQEIASLLPPGFGRNNGEKGGGGGNEGRDDEAGSENGKKNNTNQGGNNASPQPSNSKASTVEMAIEYIKVLQKDLSETKGQLEAAEKKLGEKA